MTSNTPPISRTLTVLTVGTLPIDLATAKTRLRVRHADDDSTITAMIAAGVEEFEQRTGRAFSRITAKFGLSQFPVSQTACNARLSDTNSIAIPRPPLISVESITYLDSAGVVQTLSPSAYVVSTAGAPAMISLAPGYSWPVALVRPNSILISFTAGDPANASPRIRDALLLWLDLQYHEQEPATAARIQARIDSILMNKSLRHPGLESMTVTN